ncbi:hypothetical protein IEO21_08524 [Rhodonia placenta]|uniref:Uncharacterized protein n=1 Tax=Rhodonia placenta TaxID=104341 RepID=A0A8H7TZ49_9APHY|nr:hypothetical protein IEO21_08524 [Postia placenta]
MYDVVYRAQARPSMAVHLIVGRAMQRNVRRALQRGCGVALAARQPSGGAMRSAVPASSQRGSSYNYNARLPSQPTPGARCPARHVETRASVYLVAGGSRGAEGRQDGEKGGGRVLWIGWVP